MLVASATALCVVGDLFRRVPPVTPLAGLDIAVNVLWYIPAIWLMNGAQHHPVGADAKRFLMPLFDRKDKSRYAAFTRRTLMIGGGIGAVFGALGVRLYQLQIVEGDQFRTKAEENSVSDRLLAPLRGRILDRFGVELANNRRNFRVLIIPEQASAASTPPLDTRRPNHPPRPIATARAFCATFRTNKKFVPVDWWRKT